MAGLGKTQPRLGVAFSSGFFGFFAHAGFLAALRELEITPSAYSGASSGAIVAAMAATGMSDLSIRKMLFSIEDSVRIRDFRCRLRWRPTGSGFLVNERQKG